MKNYQYPIDPDWSNEDIVHVITFLNAVESTYEQGIHFEKFQKAYNQFKDVVPSKSQEKQMGKKFEDISGYSIYRAVQLMRTKLKEENLNKKAQIMNLTTEQRRK